MEDPNAHHMTSLFAMYDSKDVSNDAIIDQAIYCLRRCHDAIVAFTANKRFLEAYRQFQHCEDVLKERNSERKVIELLPESHVDRDVFRQLDARTLILQRRFEAKRTAAVSMTESSSSPMRERVGPDAVPLRGNGGVLIGIGPSLYNTATSSPSIKGRSRVACRQHGSPSMPDRRRPDSDEEDEGAVKASGALPAIPSAAPTPTASCPGNLMRVDMLANTAGTVEGVESARSLRTVPTDAAVPREQADWRKRSESHVLRSVDVLMSAKKTVAAMKRKEEQMLARRDDALQQASFDNQLMLERLKQSPKRNASISPHKQVRKPRPPSSDNGRRASRTAERQAELDLAEAELMRRIDASAKRASLSRTYSAPRASEGLSKNPSRPSSSSAALNALTNVVYRRLSTALREASPPARTQSLTARATEADGRVDPRAHAAEKEQDVHPLLATFAAVDDKNHSCSGSSDAQRLFFPPSHESSWIEGGGQDKAAALDARLKRLRREASTKHILDEAVRYRLQTRADALATAGKLHAPAPPIRMSGDELERFLTAETVQSLRYRRTNSLFFPSLLEPEAPQRVASWSSLKKLQSFDDWTEIASRELMSNLELSVATLRLQCWWRMTMSIRERQQRAERVKKYVTQHHKEMDSVSRVVRVFRTLVAKRRVDAIRRRVDHVNEQRIELELNRGVGIINPDLSSPTRRAEDSTSRDQSCTFSRGGGYLADDLGASYFSRARSPMKRRNKYRIAQHGGGGARGDGLYERNDEEGMHRAFFNPFPRIHPHHDVLRRVQRRVAARAICGGIRGYIFRCFEEMQQTADRCMQHILSGAYEPYRHDDDWDDLQDATTAFAANPFGDDGLLAKYSGDIMQRIETQWQGLGPEKTEFVALQGVKLSALEATRRAEEEAIEQQQQLESERQRRAVELDLLEQQHRTEMAALVQRVGRGYRRRQALTRMLQSYQEQQGRLNQKFGALRIDRLSLSLTAGGASRSPTNRESPRSDARVNTAIVQLISARNPDLLPERRASIAKMRQSSAQVIQSAMRCIVSVRVVQQLRLHRNATVIQCAWRRVWKGLKEESSIQVDLRSDVVLEWF